MSTSVTDTGGRTRMMAARRKSSSVSALDSFEQTSTPWKDTSDKPTDRTSTKNWIATSKPVTTTKKTTKTTTTTTTGDPCGVTLGQYSSYLKDNLDIVRQKCSEFHACTVELYKSENLHRILAGDNIQLRNICGLMYQNANGRYRVLDNQCSPQARESIKEIMGEELSPILEGSSDRGASWGKLKTCLDNTSGDSTYLDKLCRLKGNSTLPPLCNSTDVQVTTETFFNTKLRQYHCTCNTFTEPTADSLPLRRLIGVVCGGSLILLLIVVIVVLCVRQRKLKRRLTTESKRSANTTSPTDETCCSNQGMRHHPQVPERYIAYHGAATTSRSDYDYLELLPDVACVHYKKQLPEHPATVGVQPPPQDRPCVLAKHVAPSPASDRKTRATEGPDRSLEEATYFDKIDIKSVTETSPDGGYTTLGLTPTLVVRHQSTDSEEGNSVNPQYFELESS